MAYSMTVRAGGLSRRSTVGANAAFVLGALALLGVAAVGGAVWGPILLAHWAQPGEAGGSSGENGDSSDDKRGRPVQTESLGHMTVDFRTPDGKEHFLNVSIEVELNRNIPPEDFKKFHLRCRDAAISYLRTFDFDTLNAPGRYRTMRSELKDRVTEVIGQREVRRIDFTDFVVQ